LVLRGPPPGRGRARISPAGPRTSDGARRPRRDAVPAGAFSFRGRVGRGAEGRRQRATATRTGSTRSMISGKPIGGRRVALLGGRFRVALAARPPVSRAGR